MSRLLKPSTLWFGVLAVLLLAVGAVLTIWHWDWLNGSPAETESNSTTLRNVGFIFAGVLALMFGMWRGLIAERQADAARRQVEAAQRQVETAQLSLLNERYQKSAEMLGSGILSVRLGGIYTLQRLAEDDPEQYHVPIMQQLCSFVRHPTEVEGQPIVASDEIELGMAYGASTAQDFVAAGALEIEVVREDIQAAMNSIASCHTRNLQIETLSDYWIDLHGADLRGVDLSNKNLSRAPERDETAPFDHAMIGKLHTDLRGAKLHFANLDRTNLTRTDLSLASGLTQYILDGTYADPKMPPRLDYAFDAETGEALVWRKAPDNGKW